MSSVNKVILVGRVGQDLELKKTPSGASVVSFSLATSEKFTDKQGQKVEETEWHNISAWQKSAEVLAQYLTKGSLVYIEGKLKTQSWEDNGVKKYKTEIVVGQFQFLSSNNTQQQQPQQGGGFNQAQQQPQGGGFQQQQPQQQGFPQQQQQQQQPQQQGMNINMPQQQNDMPF